MTRPRRLVPAHQQETLFGGPVTAPQTTSHRDHAVVQDPETVAAVVRAADDPGFLLIERSGRVVKADPARPGVVDSAAGHEQDTVLQLLDAGHLRTGRTEHIHHHGHEGPARTITVPKATRDMITRWSNLRPIPTQGRGRGRDGGRDGGRAGRRQRPVSAAIRVDVVELGKALVVISGTSVGGTITRNREDRARFGGGAYLVENDHGQILGTASSYRAGAEKLARHHGYRPGLIEIEHEHRAYRRS